MISPLLSYIWFDNKDRNLGEIPNLWLSVSLREIPRLSYRCCCDICVCNWVLALRVDCTSPQRSQLHSLAPCVSYSLIHSASMGCIRLDIQPSTRALRLNNPLPSRSRHLRGKGRVNYNIAFYFSFLCLVTFLQDGSYISNSNRFGGHITAAAVLSTNVRDTQVISWISQPRK